MLLFGAVFGTPFVKISMAWWGLVVQADRSSSVSFFFFFYDAPAWRIHLNCYAPFWKIVRHWCGRANNLKLCVCARGYMFLPFNVNFNDMYKRRIRLRYSVNMFQKETWAVIERKFCTVFESAWKTLHRIYTQPLQGARDTHHKNWDIKCPNANKEILCYILLNFLTSFEYSRMGTIIWGKG